MSPASNNNEGKEEKLGMVDRLAHSLFASPTSPLTAFADRQRAERLDGCRELETILKACQAANKVQERNDEIDVNPSATDDTALAPTKSGVRIARFFKWDSPHSDQNSEEGSDNNRSIIGDATAIFTDELSNAPKNKSDKRDNAKRNIQYSKACARETHEMWACRALAMGCGQHLSELRRCWDSSLLGNNGSSDTSCKGIQQNMAHCVTKHASELSERMEAAKKQ